MPAPVARAHRERITHYARTGEAHVLSARTPVGGVPALAKSGRHLCVEVGMVPFDLTGSPRRSVLLIFRDIGCPEEAELHALEAAQAEAIDAIEAT